MKESYPTQIFVAYIPNKFDVRTKEIVISIFEYANKMGLQGIECHSLKFIYREEPQGLFVDVRAIEVHPETEETL